jgi:hypothetical protein
MYICIYIYIKVDRRKMVSASLSADAVRSMKDVLDQIEDGSSERGDAHSPDYESEYERQEFHRTRSVPLGNKNTQNDVRASTGRDEDYDSRLKAAEIEMHNLSTSLAAERKVNEDLQNQLMGVLDMEQGYPSLPLPEAGEGDEGDHEKEEIGPQDVIQNSAIGTRTYATFMRDTALEIPVPEGEVSREKVKALVRRMNDMRKQARSHIARLRHVYAISQTKEKDRYELLLHTKIISYIHIYIYIYTYV